jgi:hypothetical protein
MPLHLQELAEPEHSTDLNIQPMVIRHSALSDSATQHAI